MTHAHLTRAVRDLVALGLTVRDVAVILGAHERASRR